ncbi:hypothetical protein [Streptococcus suis]|uniref:CGNR zinc finger domain-containing protein n=1 Tax=Streptococcus suis TaxID=1307 RepID=A0A3R8T887_STRSU|nr:hypothetical protein [Streptococcus suis]RRN48400.1 hypothetical protein EI219_10475 [Streptococcus suis]
MSKEKSFLGEFTFANEPVSAENESLVDEFTGSKYNRLVVKSNNSHHIKMGYSPGEGLKIINLNRRKNNPLGEFLSLKLENFIEIKAFIEKYGFIYPISNEKYCPVNLDELFFIQERLKAFIHLINSQNKSHLKLNELLDSTLYLLLKDYSVIPSTQSEYLPSKSVLQELLNSPNTELTKDHQCATSVTIEGQTQIIFSRFSQSLNENIETDMELVQQILQDENTPHWCKRIFNLFYSLDFLDLPDEIHKKIDFLFGCVCLLNPFRAELVGIKNSFTHDSYEAIKSNEYFSEYLLEISKMLISEEFERALDKVRFTYNTKTMAPDWKVPSLLSALYFSIYYKNSKNIIYRTCVNNHCRQYFEVSSTNSTKRHCSDNCRDSKNARIMRQRKKQENN